MKINFKTYNTNPNFKSAYTVSSVTINDKYYGNKQKDKLYAVTKALSDGIYRGTLSREVQDSVNRVFPDLKYHPFVMIGRSATHGQHVNILTAADAQEYKNIFLLNYSPEETRETARWVLNDILKRRGYKKISITAEEHNGKLTITGINKIQK